MEMGKTIKTLRLEKQVRQEEMAQYLGVSSQAVSKWETDSSLPDITLLADGRFDEAVPYIENLQKIKDDYQAMIYLGDVALGQGGRERAIQLWNQAVAKSPDAWQVYCERADRLKKLGMYEAAMADYEQCFTMQKPPRITDGLYSLAQMHEGRRDYKAAIADYRRIIQCIAEDHNPEPNAESERLEEEIKRLRKLAERMEI